VRCTRERASALPQQSQQHLHSRVLAWHSLLGRIRARWGEASRRDGRAWGSPPAEPVVYLLEIIRRATRPKAPKHVGMGDPTPLAGSFCSLDAARGFAPPARPRQPNVSSIFSSIFKELLIATPPRASDTPGGPRSSRRLKARAPTATAKKKPHVRRPAQLPQPRDEEARRLHSSLSRGTQDLLPVASGRGGSATEPPESDSREASALTVARSAQSGSSS